MNGYILIKLFTVRSMYTDCDDIEVIRRKRRSTIDDKNIVNAVFVNHYACNT